MLRLGTGCSIEPEVDLSGYWVDGDVAAPRAGPGRCRARVGARSMLCPGADVGEDAEVAPGSSVFGAVPDGEFWSGSPAERVSSARPRAVGGPSGDQPGWVAAYGAAAVAAAPVLPIVAVLAGAALPRAAGRRARVVRRPAAACWPGCRLGRRRAGGAGRAGARPWSRLPAVAVRPGVHPVRSRPALAVWTTIRVLDEARTWLFPLYSSQPHARSGCGCSAPGSARTSRPRRC